MFFLTHTKILIIVPLSGGEPMHFATANVDVTPWIPPLISFGISFFASMGGISGAFLLLPFQMSFLGYTNPSVSATNQLFNIIAIPSGVYRYIKERRMVWPLAWVVILGTLPGVFIGAIIRIQYLPNPKNFKLFVAIVLGYIAIRLIRDVLKKSECKPRKCSINNYSTKVLEFSFSKIKYMFQENIFQISTIWILILSFLVGIVGGIYGIGGGAIIAPFFVSVFGLPVFTVAGAALMGTFITSIAGVIYYQALSLCNPSLSIAPDWLLGSLFGVGGIIGMYLGARCQKYVQAKYIKSMIFAMIIYTSCQYLFDFFK